MMPRERQEKDPLDQILKGLDIASGIYGIKDAYDKSQILQEEHNAKKAEKQLAQQKEEQGILTKKEVDPLDAEYKRIRNEIERSKLSKAAELPIEDRLVVSGLSQKNANKAAIVNQIDAVMGNWDKLSDDQKFSQGGQLLKTLNSPEGADAVGAEEARRLGSKLEFAFGNFTNSNPTQFGRDLEGFKTQAMGTSTSLKDAIKSNQGIVGNLSGRQQKPLFNEKAQPTSDIQDAAMKELLRRKGLGAAVGKR